MERPTDTINKVKDIAIQLATFKEKERRLKEQREKRREKNLPYRRDLLLVEYIEYLESLLIQNSNSLTILTKQNKDTINDEGMKTSDFNIEWVEDVEAVPACTPTPPFKSEIIKTAEAPTLIETLGFSIVNKDLKKYFALGVENRKLLLDEWKNSGAPDEVIEKITDTLNTETKRDILLLKYLKNCVTKSV